MARSKNHKPGLSPGVGLTYTPGNDATYTESFNDYLKKRNINRNQAIGELLTIALQTLKDSYDLPDPTTVQYMDNQVPIYPSPSNLLNRSNQQPLTISKEVIENQDSSEQPKEEESSNTDHLEQEIVRNETKRKVLSDFITSTANSETPSKNFTSNDEQIKPTIEKTSNSSSKSSTDISGLARMLSGME